MAQRFEKRTGIACVFRSRHEHLELPAGVPLVAYRAVQEALTNISKHAQAQQVEIDLSLASGVLSVEVADDGRGLTPADLAKARSFGLRGLHERAETVGGWVEVSSTSAGTSVILSVPVPVRGARTPERDSQFESASVELGTEQHDPAAWGAL
jgi:signal transduction histidine kinase